MSTKGKPLTQELIFTKTKTDSLQNIKNLNLWGNDLEDLSLISKMPSLEVVSLSVNRISTLKYFSTCTKLQELYLRKNNITDLRELKYLLKLPALKVLWLYDNPCSMVDNYRFIVLKFLPNLIKLDNTLVGEEDRAKSQAVVYNLYSGGQDNYRTEPQRPMTEEYSSRASEDHRGRVGEENRNYIPTDLHYNNRPSTGNSSRNYAHPSYSSYSEELQQPLGRQMGPTEDQGNSGRKQVRQQKKYEEVEAEVEEDAEEQHQHQQQMNRNQNILMAIISLMRELDRGSLQILSREADRMLR